MLPLTLWAIQSFRSMAPHGVMLEWLIVVLASGFVFALEAINTSIELLCDLVSNEKNNMIKKIKDIAAAAVLIQAIFAIVIALILCYRIAKSCF